MTKHLTHSELDRYRERTLPPQALLAANAHLHDCEACYVRYGGDDQIGAAFGFLRSIKASDAEGAHPPSSIWPHTLMTRSVILNAS